MAIQDQNVEAARAARESLVHKFGGIAGWFRHLQDRDRKRRVRAAPGRKTAPAGRHTPVSRAANRREA